MPPAAPSAPVRRALGALGVASFAFALAGAALELLAGPGYRLGWWPLGTGLRALGWGAIAAAVAGAFGLVAALGGLRVGLRRTLALGGAAFVLGIAAAGPPAYLWWHVQRLPPLHDISTDTAHPPAFVALLPARRAAPNGADYASADAALQRRGYPDIAPLLLPDRTPAATFERARVAARGLGWRVAAEAPQEGRIEATATTLLFGFQDDVVVRIAAQGAGSRVDVRSASRIGRSDFGVNAARVRAFLARLR
ncbi:MAG TPA: DUF1499 domain-containing protein [Burkholderiaceae bacterium]